MENSCLRRVSLGSEEMYLITWEAISITMSRGAIRKKSSKQSGGAKGKSLGRL